MDELQANLDNLLTPSKPPTFELLFVNRGMYMNTVNLIIESATNYYNQLKKDENGRYRSWEHCYSEFYNARCKIPDDKYIDYLSLHLSFYLASWGMYRGSSFLLQQDYKVHIPVVKEILNSKYDDLQGVTCKNIRNYNNLKSLKQLEDFIRVYYDEKRKKISKNKPKNELSSTLITKILMGTLGCVPAYDRYFIAGMKSQHISTGIYSHNSILKIAEFYEHNSQSFEPIISKMNIGEITYPQMKFLDMGFWQIGFDLIETKNSL